MLSGSRSLRCKVHSGWEDAISTKRSQPALSGTIVLRLHRDCLGTLHQVHRLKERRVKDWNQQRISDKQ